MRIISLVPSWTETLIKSDIYPVGRTRFCIHPNEAVQKIPIVGGTKTVNWDLITELKPDLLILDKEENPQIFSTQGFPFWASHVKDGVSLQRDLFELANLLSSEKLLQQAKLAEKINSAAPSPKGLQQGILEVLKPWNGDEEFAYIIWKNPWMSISRETYIGFVLEKLGLKLHRWDHSNSAYPVVELDPKKDLVYLFSSEPYPFIKDKEELLKLNVKAALVDGEKMSWFGSRSLEFLQKALEISDPE